MNTINYNVRIENEKFGVLLNENFVDGIQFKLFLKMINGALELKTNLTFFNGLDTYGMSEIVKSKIEALITK